MNSTNAARHYSPTEDVTPLKRLFFSPDTARLQNSYKTFNQLPPILRVILSTDGTVTSVLESFFWETVKVDVLTHEMLILITTSWNSTQGRVKQC